MKLSVMKNLLVFAGFVFLLTSCDPDIIDPPGVDDPSVSVTGTPSAAITAGETFSITVAATPTAENALNSVAFKEDNVNIPFSRITIDGVAASANPVLLFGDDKNGFTWNVEITSHEDVSTKQYEVEVTDEGNNSDGFTFDVETELIVVQPTLSVAGNMSIMLDPGATLAVDATLGKGTYDIVSMAFYQGDDLISDYDRIGYKELSNKINDNPYPLPDEDKAGGEVKIWLKVQETSGTVPYRFVITDELGNSADYSFDIITGTAVDILDGVLFNAGGPVGTGGVDLDTGESTGSNDAAAEVKDLGIDTDLPQETNWIQRITGANNSEMKVLIAGQNGLSEDFSFESVNSKESIASLFDDNGIDFTEMVDGEMASAVVEVGDVYVVKRDDAYYLFVVREVNVITSGEATELNRDNYVIDIKK